MPATKRPSESRSSSCKKSRAKLDANEATANNKYNGKSVFTKLMKECGVVLMDGKKANMILKDQNVFLKEFPKSIKRHEDFPEVVDDIIVGVRKYAEDEERFLRMMMTTDFVEERNQDWDIMQKVAQDSVMRLLLKTQLLQVGVGDLLIEKMENYKENSSLQLEIGPFDNHGETINVPQLILNQLRWLDVVEDADTIAVKLLDTATVMSYHTACAIVTSLPEIVGDEVHDKVAGRLKELLASNIELTIAILDTLCSLNCSLKAMEDIKNTIFSRLNCVKIEELPIVVKFLLQTMNSENAEQNITCLRQHLTFSPATLSQNSQTNSSNHKEGSEVTAIKLTAEAILHAAQYQAFVADSWLKILKNAEFTSTDLISLIILCSNYNPNAKKSAVALMKNKFLSGLITDDLIELTFEECSVVLVPYFNTLSDLASQYVSSSSSSLQHFGSVLYISMFSHMDNYCRQEVVGFLVQHVGSFCASEVDVALGVLRSISINNLSLLTPFTLFIRGIIDHVERLSCRQVRLVYEVLSRLAFGKASNMAPTIEDELHMIIRKQLTHSSMTFRYIGIIGAVNMLKILGCVEGSDEKDHKTIASILGVLEEATVHNSKSRAFFLDELGVLLRNDVDPWLRKQIFKLLQKQMDEKFHKAAIPATQSSATKAMFAIGAESAVKVPIYSAVQQSDFQYHLFCPLFKAIARSSNRPQEKTLTLAASPVMLDQSVFDEKDFKLQPFTQQKMLLDSLLVTLNWFREHIGFFSGEQSQHKHALSRIDHIMKLHRVIESLAGVFAKYTPPIMILEFGHSSVSGEYSAASSTQAGQELNCSNSINGTSEDSSSIQKKMKGTKKKMDSSFSIAGLKPQYLREIHLDAMKLLEISMGENIFEQENNVESCSGENNQLFPHHLLFLLQDLKKKVAYKLPSLDTDKKASPFTSAPTNVGFQDLELMSEVDFGKRVSHVLPHLFNHLESISTSFCDDGADDLEDLEIDKRQLLVACYENLLEITFLTFAWKGIKNDLEMMKSVLTSIGKRITPELSDHSAVRDLIKSVFSYVKNFQDVVKKVSLHSATFLAKLLVTIAGLHGGEYEEEFKRDIHSFTLLMLKVEWSSSIGQTISSGGKRNEMLAYMLKLNFQTADEILRVIRHFVDEGLSKIGHEDASYPCFQRSNCHVLYACILEILTEETGKIHAVRQKDDETTSIELLLRWSDAMKVIGVVTKFLREFHTRANIVASLKCGRILIENFIKNGMLTCEKMFHLYQDDIVSILKHLQTTTRQLQHLTCHSKVVKDVSLAKQVPPLKKALETLLFRVKGMLAFHNCQEAFWLGNLKNRNLQGEELLSQMTQQENSDADSSDLNFDYQDMSYSESY